MHAFHAVKAFVLTHKNHQITDILLHRTCNSKLLCSDKSNVFKCILRVDYSRPIFHASTRCFNDISSYL